MQHINSEINQHWYISTDFKCAKSTFIWSPTDIMWKHSHFITQLGLPIPKHSKIPSHSLPLRNMNIFFK